MMENVMFYEVYIHQARGGFHIGHICVESTNFSKVNPDLDLQPTTLSLTWPGEGKG